MKKLTFTVAIVGLITATIAAQTNQKLAQAQKENARALMQYEWKSRTEIQKDGETKKDQLVLMRYDSNGELQQAVIASSPEPDLPTRGLRGLIARNKKNEFMKKIEDLRHLVKSYSEPETMQRFMATAKVTPEQNLVRLKGFDVLQSGDSMTIWIDMISKKQRRIEIQTAMDEKPVQIVSEFQDISPTGPTYMSRNQVNYSGTSLVIITQNFDYTLAKQSESAAVNR
jgi:G3E family GTPase